MPEPNPREPPKVMSGTQGFCHSAPSDPLEMLISATPHVCSGLPCQAAEHHTAIHSPTLSGVGERIGKKGKTLSLR